MVEDLPASAGDTGSIPGPGGSHMPQSSKAHTPQLGSLCVRATESQLLKPVSLEPVHRNRRRHCRGKPAQHSQRVAPAHSPREKPVQ